MNQSKYLLRQFLIRETQDPFGKKSISRMCLICLANKICDAVRNRRAVTNFSDGGLVIKANLKRSTSVIDRQISIKARQSDFEFLLFRFFPFPSPGALDLSDSVVQRVAR